MGPDAIILVFLIFIFKLTLSLFSFTLIKWLFSSSSLSAIRVVSPTYLRLLMFLPPVLIPACNSFSRRRQWHPAPVLLPGKSHGWRSPVGCSPWGHEESDMTERLHFHFSLSCMGEGNGNPLQCSCLENPRDGGCRLWGHTESDTAEATQQQQQQQQQLIQPSTSHDVLSIQIKQTGWQQTAVLLSQSWTNQLFHTGFWLLLLDPHTSFSGDR